MTQTVLFAAAANGLKELTSMLFIYYIFRHRMRLSPRAIAVFYILMFLAETAFCLWRGDGFTVREIYALSFLRGLTVFAFLKEHPAKICFTFSFVAYANVLKHNITLTLANYYQIPFLPEQTGYILSIIFSLLMLYPLFCLGRYFGKYLERATSTRLLTLASVITFSLLIAITTQQHFGRVYDAEHFIARFLIMTPGLIFLGVMLYLLQQLDTNQRLSRSVTNLQALYEKEHDYYKETLKNRDEAAELSRAVEAGTDYTLRLLDAEDYDALEKHFHSMLASADSLRRISLCGHQVVDAVVGYWQMRASEISIDFTADIRINNIHIDDLDLAIVLGNTLENAYTAASQSGVPTPRIALKLVSQNELLIMSLENSFNGQWVAENGQYYSAKHDFTQPGTGISNVLLVVEKYDGYSKIQPRDKTFLFQLALSNRRPEE